MDSNYHSKDIDNIIDSLFNYIETNQSTLKILNDPKFYNYIGRERIIENYYEEYGIVEPVYRWLERGKNLDQLDIHDINFTSHFYVNVIDQMVTQIIVGKMPYDLETLKHNIKELTKRVLGVQKGGSIET
jgi:hypothetical protein